MTEWGKFKHGLLLLQEVVEGVEHGGAQHWVFWRHVILWWLTEAVRDLPAECPFTDEEGEDEW